MMSAYRELKDTTELDKHLETCASCRKTLASSTQIGERVRSAPVFAPPPDAHARLMKALADEQLKFLQKSAPDKVSTPDFLKPYLQELAEEETKDNIATFSSAETGPLPIIRARRKPRKAQVKQFAVLGLAAALVIMLMTGALTSLLMLARSNPTSLPKNSVASLAQQTEVDQKTYTIGTTYPNVTSTLPSGNSIYYTATGSGNNGNMWMLMQFDRSTQTIKPLLDTPRSSPLILLAASDTWLVWLQYDRPQAITHGNSPNANSPYSPKRAWNLYYLSLLPQPQNPANTANPTPTASTQPDQPTPDVSPDTSDSPSSTTTTQSSPPGPLLLTQGFFDSNNAPTWVTTPIQGVWLLHNTLLVTQIDEQGISHLDSYLLGQTDGNTWKVEIAATHPGHVLTWPTADSRGMQIYWADEWVSEDGVLHSNIWEQNASEQNLSSHGYPNIQTTFTQTELLNDGLSFQPQVVDNTLFFISTSQVVVSNQGANQAPNGTPFPTSATDASVMFTPRTDLSIYPAPPDASVHGTIFMIPLDGPNVGSESMLGTVGQSTGFQTGNSFVIWQDNTGYKMYDVGQQNEVIVGETLDSSTLLVVNANTTLWLTKQASSQELTMMAYNWPN
jgi:hypothetical protein